MKRSILVVAGEISGDQHAAKVVKAYKSLSPGTVFWGLGGDELHHEGVELLQHTDRMSVMGIAEVLMHYRFLKRVFNQVLDEVDRRKPDAALLVDYPGFNLRLARELKSRGVKVYYYICPKVWAWNKKRIPKMADIIDRLLVIFPFEVEVFRGTGLQVDFVGNPLMAQIDGLLAAPPKSLPWGPGRRVALLPGSRKQEILRILPTILKAARRLESRVRNLSFMIAAPNERIERLVRNVIEHSPEQLCSLTVVRGQAREVLRQAEAAIVTSGTATLETALIGTPQIIVYKTSMATSLFARAVLTIPYVGLVNIVAGKAVCPELLQSKAKPEAIADAFSRLLEDTPERRAMFAGYAEVRNILGTENASENAAGILLLD